MGILTDIKFETIKHVIDKYELRGMLTYLCKCINIFKVGYYNYLKNETKRIERDNKVQKDFDLIIKTYNLRDVKRGIDK